jgi:Flp pilus assembly protein CpaB
MTPTEYLLIAAVALIVAGFVAVLVWKLWLTPAEHARIKAAASRIDSPSGSDAQTSDKRGQH